MKKLVFPTAHQKTEENQENFGFSSPSLTSSLTSANAFQKLTHIYLMYEYDMHQRLLKPNNVFEHIEHLINYL